MNSNEPTQLPPPSAEEAARRKFDLELQARRRRSKRLRPWWIGGGLLGVTGLIGMGALADADKDDGGKKMTLVEAACQLLGDGETPEFTYSVMKDLAADHPLAYGEDESIAARAAVDRAQDQGC